MDWFSWLSKTNLDPSLIYEYGLTFARNELQEEDVAYFNHEFLQSMGISIAKHRLEILKRARKEAAGGSISLSRLRIAINKTRRSIRKCLTKLLSHDQESVFKALPEPPEPVHYKEQWRGGLTRNKLKTDKDHFPVEKVQFPVEKVQSPVIGTRRQAKSGPLDVKLLENISMQNPRILKLSGPLDGRVPEHLMPSDDVKVQDRLVFAYRSPKLSDGRVHQRLVGPGNRPNVPRPLDGNKERSIPDDFDDQWSGLFQHMKPT